MSDNPKAMCGRTKARFCFTPPAPLVLVGKVMQSGAEKYGPFNWRDDPIKASDYYDAINRHLQAWFDGETHDPESGINHLAHVAACCFVVMDASDCCSLIDDRPQGGKAAATMAFLKNAYENRLVHVSDMSPY